MWDRHAINLHENHCRYSCPQADKYNCTQSFARTESATRHARQVHEKIRHSKVHTDRPQLYPCPHAKEFSCTRTSKIQRSVDRHAQTHTELWKGTLPMCVKSVTQYLMAKASMDHHMYIHVQRGHCDGLKGYSKPRKWSIPTKFGIMDPSYNDVSEVTTGNADSSEVTQ